MFPLRLTVFQYVFNKINKTAGRVSFYSKKWNLAFAVWRGMIFVEMPQHDFYFSVLSTFLFCSMVSVFEFAAAF